EDEQLALEREVLTNAERLAGEALLAYQLLAGGESDDEQPAALDALKRASVQLDAIAAIDSSMAPTAERLREISFLLEDAIVETRSYRERIEANPQRLESIEERLDLVRKLKRKYGATIAEINRYGDEAATELESLTSGAFDVDTLRAEEGALLQKLS